MIDNDLTISLRVKDQLNFKWITIGDAKNENPVSFLPTDKDAAQNYTVTFESFDMWGTSGKFPTLRSDVITVVVTKSDSESVDPNKKDPDAEKKDDKVEDKKDPVVDDKAKGGEAVAVVTPTCSLDANKDRTMQVALNQSPI